jgi:hypothetical protein
MRADWAVVILGCGLSFDVTTEPTNNEEVEVAIFSFSRQLLLSKSFPGHSYQLADGNRDETVEDRALDVLLALPSNGSSSTMASCAVCAVVLLQSARAYDPRDSMETAYDV